MRRPTLRIGDRGPFVGQLQQRMLVLGYHLGPRGADEDFGPITDQRVKQFQQQHGLPGTGVVDDKTWAQFDIEEAKRRHEEIHASFATDHEEPESSVPEAPARPPADGPPKPDFSPLIGNEARSAVFGAFKYKPAPTAVNPEAIAYLDGWPDKNLVTVRVPQLSLIPGIEHEGRRVGRGPKSGNETVHRLVAEPFRALWQAWEDAGLLSLVITWAGMWSPRFVRGSRSVLSNHAWATAFDINAPWNGLGAKPADYGARGSVRELVPLAHAHGFYWGGHFPRRQDGMHFEAARIP